VLAVVMAVGAAAFADAITFLLFASYAVVGVLLVIRRPRNPVSWLVLVIPFAFVGTSTPPDLDADALSRGTGPLRDTVRVCGPKRDGRRLEQRSIDALATVTDAVRAVIHPG
jgi:hypothetical protein